MLKILLLVFQTLSSLIAFCLHQGKKNKLILNYPNHEAPTTLHIPQQLHTGVIPSA